jgi:hypothetical protein
MLLNSPYKIDEKTLSIIAEIFASSIDFKVNNSDAMLRFTSELFDKLHLREKHDKGTLSIIESYIYNLVSRFFLNYG